MQDNFDLKKFLVENRLTPSAQKLKENTSKNISPEKAVDYAMKLVPKFEKSPEFDKLATQIAQDPKLMQQLEKALSQGGAQMNENVGELDNNDLETLALNLAKKGDHKMNEAEDDGTAVGAGFLAFATGGTLAANFSAAIAAAVPVLGTLFAGPAVAGAIAGAALYALGRKVYQKVKNGSDSGTKHDPNYLKNKFKDSGFNVNEDLTDPFPRFQGSTMKEFVRWAVPIFKANNVAKEDYIDWFRQIDDDGGVSDYRGATEKELMDVHFGAWYPEYGSEMPNDEPYADKIKKSRY
jgi:hypothetical protein